MSAFGIAGFDDRPTVECPECDGEGWDVEAAHDPSCDGSSRCDSTCPVPTQVQCSTCRGSGEVPA